MNTVFRLSLLLAVLAPVILALQPATLDAQTQRVRLPRVLEYERRRCPADVCGNVLAADAGHQRRGDETGAQ